MSDNIYAPPESKLETDQLNTSDTTASRWRRLWASLIDGLTIMIITVPTMYLTGGIEDIMNGIEPSLEYNIAIGLLGLVIFLVINLKLLIKNGQTIGKLALGIKIVDLDGNLPSMKKHLLKRYAVFFIPGQIPIAGQIFSIINILAIFGSEKRCIHDYFASTKVINA